jgi:hypothetical protein
LSDAYVTEWDGKKLATFRRRYDRERSVVLHRPYLAIDQ